MYLPTFPQLLATLYYSQLIRLTKTFIFQPWVDNYFEVH